MNPLSRPQIKRWLPEILLVLLIISIAAFFRFWDIDGVPAGLHYDEAIDLNQGLRVLDGDLFLYTEEGWGREGLYYYLVAASLAIIPDNVVAIRATVALISLGVAIASYFLARRFTDVMTAWFSVAWFAVLFWSVFAGRFAVRGMTLPLIFGFAVLAFWKAWDSDEVRSGRRAVIWMIPGFFLGLAMYSYQPARFLPGLFLLFSVYLWLIHRHEFKRIWRGLLIMAAAALVVAIPLIIILVTNPGLESGREWTIAPLTELLSGRPSLLLDNIVATAKMFPFSGDPLIADNIPLRPIFIPRWTSLFFYAGFVIALFRWRKPPFAFVLLWLFVSVLPTIVTTSAPNFNRLVGALFPITFLAALPVSVAYSYVKEKWGPWLAFLPVAVAIIAVGVTALYTWQDYFTKWPLTREDDYNVQFNTVIEEMADRLEEQVGSQPVLINSRNLEDSHPYILAATSDVRDVPLRWVDTGQAIVRPPGAESALLFLADNRWSSALLLGFLNNAGEALETYDHFSVYGINFESWPEEMRLSLHYLQGDQLPSSDLSRAVMSTPVSFEDRLQLAGIYDLESDLIPGNQLTFFSRWDVLEDGQPAPMAFFVHLTNEDGDLISQQDGMGFPPHSWQSGDSFVQQHTLALPPSLPSGSYYLQLGIYDRGSGQRWQVLVDGAPGGDRLSLPELSVR